MRFPPEEGEDIASRLAGGCARCRPTVRQADQQRGIALQWLATDRAEVRLTWA